MLEISDPYLFETPHGTVLRCARCGRIQVEFRGQTLLVDTPYVQALSREVAHVVAEIEAGPSASGWWHLSAATGVGPASLLLCTEGMLALHELLKGTQAMLELEQMLSDVLRN